MHRTLIALMLLLILSACAPSEGAVQTAIVKTQLAQPTAAASATKTVKPTLTKQPTRTPRPTRTPAPTKTITRTPTVEPTLAPVVFEGTGDQVIDLKWVGAGFAKITGNQAGRHFAVIAHEKNGDDEELLVNTTEPYTGVVAFNLQDDQEAGLLEVKANGPWKIEITDMSGIKRYYASDVAITAEGDDVFLLGPRKCTSMVIVGNVDSRHFAVAVINEDGSDLLVNTTETYSGTVICPATPALVIIKATGLWAMTIQ